MDKVHIVNALINLKNQDYLLQLIYIQFVGYLKNGFPGEAPLKPKEQKKMFKDFANAYEEERKDIIKKREKLVSLLKPKDRKGLKSFLGKWEVKSVGLSGFLASIQIGKKR